MPAAVVVMGVSGCGKSTVAAALAERLHGVYLDADDYHPASNVQKMHDGVPLTDVDRRPWLRAVGIAMREHRDSPGGGPVVMACSALKRTYRDELRESVPDAVFVHLTGTRELLEQRLLARHGHFMPASLLDSQLQTLQPLSTDERGGAVDVAGVPDQVVERALDIVGHAGG